MVRPPIPVGRLHLGQQRQELELMQRRVLLHHPGVRGLLRRDLELRYFMKRTQDEMNRNVGESQSLLRF
jgi:hypothetical protein